MNKQLKELNLLWNRMGVNETLKIRIGINTDEALTGNVGSPERMQFSAIGDGVNVASRLEAVNKVYGTDILISNKTAKLIENGFNLREIDTVLVPGRDTPIDLYEVIDPENYSQELNEKYAKALKEYRNKNFEEAIVLWEACLITNPNDSPSQVMLERVVKLKQTQTVSSWQPIWTVENK
jgi:adenylate cyclase